MKTAVQILMEQCGNFAIPFDEHVDLYFPSIIAAMEEYASQFKFGGLTRENVKSIIHWTHDALHNGKITGSDNEIANNCMKELSIASSSAPEEKIGDEDIERWVCSGICDEFKSIFMDGAVFGVKAYRDGTISEWVKNN